MTRRGQRLRDDDAQLRRYAGSRHPFVLDQPRQRRGWLTRHEQGRPDQQETEHAGDGEPG